MGRAICERLLSEPWCGPLVVADLDRGGVEALAAELPGDVTAIPVDVTDDASIAALVASAGDARRLAVAAGVMVPSVSALATTRADFERTLAVNLTGSFLVAQAFARAMAERDGGAIVAISAIGGIVPRWQQTAYSASKAGLQMALRVLGLEAMAAGVRVNVISPGGVDTPMSRAWAASQPGVDPSAGNLDSYRTKVPRGRMADTGDIAAAVAFLLGPDSAHIALQDLVVDGGELLGV
jgi:2,3-dihydro-2,3-dihydroxybenzoate dehydrogenase